MSANNVITDNGFSTAAQHGPPRFFAPFDGDNTFYVIEQDYVISQASFAATTLNTVADSTQVCPGGTTFGSFKLQKESQPAPVNCGDIVLWTRTYVSTPNSRNEASTTNYKFIGYAGDTTLLKVNSGGVLQNYSGATYVQGRRPFTQTVPLTIVKDYFLCGSGGTYATPDLIPVNLAQKYYFQLGTTSIATGVMTFTPTYATGSPADIANGIPTEYICDASGAAYYYSPIGSNPTRTAYQALVTAGSLITVEDSSITRWMGNVWERTTKKVTAR